MKKFQLGEFEEIVLLTVGVLYDEAYGVAIKDEIEKRLERKVSVGALQSALRRMEKKGFLDSREGDPTEQRSYCDKSGCHSCRSLAVIAVC